MPLTNQQREICNKRLFEHMHSNYEVDLDLGNLTLRSFIVKRGVFRPETTSGYYFAKFLASHPSLFSGKSVLDMCCGSGIQGIVAGKLGASEICFSDISEAAVKNTRDNIIRFNLTDKSNVVRGDLFENVTGKFDVILCNHPFFDNEPDAGHPITRSWFDPGTLIVRFLTNAKNYLNAGGIILVPYFLFAGDKNNPLLVAKKLNLASSIIYRETINDANIQKGEFMVVKITFI